MFFFFQIVWNVIAFQLCIHTPKAFVLLNIKWYYSFYSFHDFELPIFQNISFELKYIHISTKKMLLLQKCGFVQISFFEKKKNIENKASFFQPNTI